jgi:hypothetical protein
MANKVLPAAGEKRKPPAAGMGRVKGVPNKTTALLKDAILRAAEQAGNKVGNDGLVSYLEVQAVENPGPFMSLLGKVLPMQVVGADGGAVQVELVKRVIVDPRNPDS